LATVQKRPKSDQDLLGGVPIPAVDEVISQRLTQKMLLRSPLQEIRIYFLNIAVWKQPETHSFQPYECF